MCSSGGGGSAPAAPAPLKSPTGQAGRQSDIDEQRRRAFANARQPSALGGQQQAASNTANTGQTQLLGQ